MPAIIWKKVHDDKRIPAPIQYQTLLVFTAMWGETEYARIRFGRQDIFYAPRRPKLLHSSAHWGIVLQSVVITLYISLFMSKLF